MPVRRGLVALDDRPIQHGRAPPQDRNASAPCRIRRIHHVAVHAAVVEQERAAAGHSHTAAPPRREAARHVDRHQPHHCARAVDEHHPLRRACSGHVEHGVGLGFDRHTATDLERAVKAVPRAALEQDDRVDRRVGQRVHELVDTAHLLHATPEKYPGPLL